MVEGGVFGCGSEVFAGQSIPQSTTAENRRVASSLYTREPYRLGL